MGAGRARDEVWVLFLLWVPHVQKRAIASLTPQMNKYIFLVLYEIPHDGVGYGITTQNS